MSFGLYDRKDTEIQGTFQPKSLSTDRTAVMDSVDNTRYLDQNFCLYP